jgi:hypothetical protein
MKEISLGFQIEYDHYLDFDDSEGLILQYFVGESHSDDPLEITIPFDGLVDDVLDEGRQEADYQFLYTVAHEFSRYAEKIRAEAYTMEGDMASIGDYYGIEPGDL